MTMRFVDRTDAGRQLAEQLDGYRKDSPLVLGLPRGGVQVAYEVARGLDAPLDVWVVRKVGAPRFPELGVGAVAEGGIVYLNRETIGEVGATESEVEELVRQKQAEVAQRVGLFRGDRPGPRVTGRAIILVDDGIATGGTARAAIQALRVARPKKIVLAVPVAASQALEELMPLLDDIVCVQSTPALYAIGAWYDDFRQVADREVARFLERARHEEPRGAPPPLEVAPDPRDVTISLSDAELKGALALPSDPKGLVLFAHGSGSSRLSPRNRHVASVLHGFGLGTLLFDLLTHEEEAVDLETAELRFDIDFLAQRLVQVTDWVMSSSGLGSVPLGYFGSSTGAAAALVAATERPEVVRAVVSRGGRPDLASESLRRVRAPTLLVVGGADHTVLGLNRRAYAQLATTRSLVVVPGATHLFQEPGALDAVARLAGEWFVEHLPAPRTRLETSAEGLTGHP
jgi:putative phosphoribosyl transferase